ncbi:glycoside hydrolase 5 family protein [Pseudochryseolinea flava]|uniref:Glycoside hydrolase n=1 Tax=Pseudochryseolinea flava TaxID=2059302 RepID=A0A364Y069_9BACT|nr:DUF5060 domain-containing protein [Pseudochryseolinea flava]RAV99459.1 glycoside hydrolase [Pseudochryseolinea flava]
MKNIIVSAFLLVMTSAAFGQGISKVSQKSKNITQYEKGEFEVIVDGLFKNPFDLREIVIDMEISTPSGKTLVLPTYFDSERNGQSLFKANFSPQESGNYQCHFVVRSGVKKDSKSKILKFTAVASKGNGFLHIGDYWTLKFDSGKPFRGIGENVGWESRTFEDKKWTYDYLLPTLSSNGANFFRTWMCVWNMPLIWKKVVNTNRYQHSNEYFHQGGVKRMDELVALCDSLDLYMMLAFDWHGALIADGEWKDHPYNIVNGGPAKNPTEFFTHAECKAMYKNKLRYIVARWGYSKNIAAWEFFNEVDNAAFTATPQDSIRIPLQAITQWHDEMSTYLKSIDPYQHIVTTSISHRDIDGMNDLKNIDLNQKHIYNKTHLLAPTILAYTKRHEKPYVIGEFGYDWNWDNVTHERGEGFDYDYKRGLWYGLMTPTPILPMTWWWEFFDERNMTPYFKGVSEINNAMLAAGNGKFESIETKNTNVETFAVKCGNTFFVYLLNSTGETINATAGLLVEGQGNFSVKRFDPLTTENTLLSRLKGDKDGITIPEILLDKHQEVVLIITGEEQKAKLDR